MQCKKKKKKSNWANLDKNQMESTAEQQVPIKDSGSGMYSK